MMRTSGWLGVWLVAASITSCAASHTQPIGAPCVSDDECESAVCGGLEIDRCTTVCEGDDDCAGGWRCASELADPVCACVPRPEYCNGIDDDCDGVIDETSAALCPASQMCNSSGSCVCPDGWPLRRAMTGKVDLLLMIDNSGPMAEEQASFARELPRLVQVLSSGDLDDDGSVDFVPTWSLRVAVISSDMGVGGHAVPTCDSGTFGADYGDDGILLTRGRTGVEGCLATYPAVFAFEGDPVDPMRFADHLACVATTGTSGCGWEQQLDAVLKAVSPSAPQEWTIAGYEPPRFVDGTRGHADGANAGFVRRDAVLAIVMLTDEEDCSAANTGLFDVSDPEFASADLSLRCFAFPEALHPIERYVAGDEGRAGLLGLREDPELLVFGVVAGIPTDAVPAPGTAIDYDAILAHPSMVERRDATMPTRLVPSCTVPGRGLAFPPRRMVRVAQGLESGGAQVALGSICQESYAEFTASLLEAIARLGPVECE